MTNQKSLLIALILAIFINLNVECRPNYMSNRQLIEQLLQPDYLTPEQENLQEIYDKMNQISDSNDPNFLSNWPYLNELLRRELSSKDQIQYDMLPTAQPLQQVQPIRNAIKDSAQKKNSNYMHACHFKICNMGRKRNVRYDN